MGDVSFRDTGLARVRETFNEPQPPQDSLRFSMHKLLPYAARGGPFPLAAQMHGLRHETRDVRLGALLSCRGGAGVQWRPPNSVEQRKPLRLKPGVIDEWRGCPASKRCQTRIAVC